MAYTVHQINNNSWRIEDEVVNIFLFEGNDRALLVDTGFGAGDLLSCIRELTDKPILLINTHSDPDHASGNKAFSKTLMHPAEFANYAKNHAETIPVEAVWDGDVIELGGRSFEVVLLPGHTPGSIALLERDARVIITGDTVTDSPVFIFGEERNVSAIIESLKKLESMACICDVIYPSHGSFPLGMDAVTLQRETAELLLDGKLTPLDPPMDIPAKMYLNGKAGFFY